MPESSITNPYRLLPSVEEVLGRRPVAALAGRIPRELLVELVQRVLADWREDIRAARLDSLGLERRLAEGDLERALEVLIRREEGAGLRRAINVSGVVLNTGLGRAPVHPDAARAMAEVAASFCVLEVDRETGRRNRRDERLSVLLGRLTGAEAGIAVNNNAAACVLLLNTFAQGRETIVSRGELVEIGGSFRMPDVMARAGTRLVEVGTTNRTRENDYRRAIGAETGLLLKVHTSNYRQVGFVEEVGARDLAELGREAGIPCAFDLGSGRLDPEGARPLDVVGDEPLVRATVEAGMDVVTFSGDKLLGGPQAGLVVGRRDAVEALRANPLYRALRLDKVTIAGLECSLELLLAGRGDELPTRSMLLARPEELEPIARSLGVQLAALGFDVEVARDRSQPGSGSAPGVYLDTWVVRVRRSGLSTEQLASELRASDPPVFARIQDDRLVLDPRTLFEGEEEELVRAFEALA